MCNFTYLRIGILAWGRFRMSMRNILHIVADAYRCGFAEKAPRLNSRPHFQEEAQLCAAR